MSGSWHHSDASSLEATLLRKPTDRPTHDRTIPIEGNDLHHLNLASGRSGESDMGRTYSLVFAFMFCLASHPVFADTIACDSADLGLVNPTAEEKVDAMVKQATECVREKKPGRAVAILTQIIKNDPTNAAAYLNRGSAQATLGELSFALDDYRTALRLAPDMVEAWYNRGTTLAHMHRFEAAIADFTEAIRLKPDFALAYCNRGLSEVELARYDDAIADYTVAIGKEPDLTYCRANRGNLYLMLGEYQKAIDDFTAAFGEHPTDANALSRRGQAHEAMGQIKEAIDDYSAALEIDPQLESAKEGLSRLSQPQKQSDR
jgi:Tfp pilus assembly protein PilF